MIKTHSPRLFTSLFVLTITMLILSGCTFNLFVRGQVENSTETFLGTATGIKSRNGSMEVITSKGSHCNGSFVYTGSHMGTGIFTCDDGRTGPFEFSYHGLIGVGVGRVGDHKFTFTFGEKIQG
jgi:hypothetical protein